MIPDNELIIITEDEEGKRLDRILGDRFNGIRSRTYFQKLFDEEKILLNGFPVKKRTQPHLGDEVQIQFILTPEIGLEPENIPLEIVYEDDHLIVINKAAGMVVHPAVGNWTGTFVNALLYHCQQIKDLQGSKELRPGIVHRLDKETSGLLIAAKTANSQLKLLEMFASRSMYKEYLAICVGNPGNGILELPIGRHPVHRQKMAIIESGKPAITSYETIKTDGKLSVVKIILTTGRTHQIRVHMKHLNCPILGDSLYGNQDLNQKYNAKRQLLHAYHLGLNHPITGIKLFFEAPIPQDIKAFLEKIDLSKK